MRHKTTKPLGKKQKCKRKSLSRARQIILRFDRSMICEMKIDKQEFINVNALLCESPWEGNEKTTYR